jgi:signal peptidase I
MSELGIHAAGSKKGKAREYVEAFAVALVIALIVRTLLLQAFKIPSGSMENTLLVGDHIFVNKFIYGYHVPYTKGRILAFTTPKRGDIVVFVFPEDPSKDFIKRVVGTPGDMVEVRQKTVYVNGWKSTRVSRTGKTPTVSFAAGTTCHLCGCPPENSSRWGTTATGRTTPASGGSSTWTPSSARRCSSTSPSTGIAASDGRMWGATPSSSAGIGSDACCVSAPPSLCR